MTDKLSNDLANAAERALQWIDAASSGNPGQARFDIRVLRQLIAEVRNTSCKHMSEEEAVEVMAEAIHNKWFLGERKWGHATELGKSTYREYASAAYNALLKVAQIQSKQP